MTRGLRSAFLPVLLGAALLITGTGSGSAGVASAAPQGGAAGGLANLCLGQSNARVPKWGSPVREPADIGPTQAAQLMQQLQPGLAVAQRDSARGRLLVGAVTVRTWVHVISTDRTATGGNVSDQQIRDQIRVLNRSFAGRTDGAPTVFRFELVGVTRTVNAAWSTMEPESAEEFAAKRALHRGGPKTLNLYVTQTPLLLGWAYLPDGEVEQSALDGVVVLAGSLPGGDVVPYNEGDTATHEVGHWLSLLHTFDNACDVPGDYVFDTPYEAEPAFGCPIGRDTCVQPGNDPVKNFMDYSDDPCMHQFTGGQSLRMWAAWRVFRA